MPAAAQPEYELSIEMTSGMSALPIGRVRNQKSCKESSVAASAANLQRDFF
jgi:hypothetical protein